MTQSRRGHLLVGVKAGQPEIVLTSAVRFAEALDADLVCAHVDVGRYLVEEQPDGSVVSRPLEPELPLLSSADFDPVLADQIRSVVEATGTGRVAVSFCEVAGDRAYALARLAEIWQVEAVVVGSRRQGVRSTLKEFFGGSVAAGLAHRQRRPVIVVPVAPVPPGSPLPWDEEAG